MNIKAVLFDLDGTIVNSEPFYFEIWKPILKREFGVSISLDDWFNEFVGHTIQHNVQMLNAKYGVDTTEEFVRSIVHAAYAAADYTQAGLMPSVKEILVHLQDKGIRLGLVTSSYRPTVRALLGQHDLLGYFEFLVTREDVLHPKPDPEPYVLGIERLGIAREYILAIEDTIAGTASARAAGLLCLSVSNVEVERNRLSGHSDYLVRDLKEGLALLGL